MKLVIQYVSKAAVRVQGEIRSIRQGYMVLVGIHPKDSKESVIALANKLLNVRIIPDTQGKLNLSIQDIGGDLLIISQFTLYGDCSHGNRPSYSKAAPATLAIPLYEAFITYLKQRGLVVKTGDFGAQMDVSLTNSGPITLILENEMASP